MRIGVAWEPDQAASTYRAVAPMRMMERLGHTVVWPPTSAGEIDLARLGDCDLLHVYRRSDDESQSLLRQLSAHGVGLTWDNDDDLSVVPEESPHYKDFSNGRGALAFRTTVRAAKLARLATVTNETLADRYRAAGVKQVRVVPNFLNGGLRPRQRHTGIIVGWIAGVEHTADAIRLQLPDVLRRLQEAHPDVHVECIGVDLGLPTRYTHSRLVQFNELPEHMARFDIGIAPLADIPFNHTRSDIKVKEYAASGVAWLASDLTPYRQLGEPQGGRLVADGDWFAELDRLVRNREERLALAKQGQQWAKTQRIESASKSWEAVFLEAAALTRKRA